jgi:hypothetical protein
MIFTINAATLLRESSVPLNDSFFSVVSLVAFVIVRQPCRSQDSVVQPGRLDDISGSTKRRPIRTDLASEEYEESWRAYLRYLVSFQNPGAEAVRPGRRLLWIDKALEPVQSLRPPKRYRELRNGLALTLGIEPIIVLRDVCQLEYKQARQVLWSTARTLLRSYLDDTAYRKG